MNILPDVRSPSEVASGDHFEKAQKNDCSTRSNSDFAWSGDTLPADSYVKTLKLEEKTKREEKLKVKAAAIEQFLSPTELRAVSDAKDPDASN